MELATEPLPLSFRAITFHEVSERPRDNHEDDGVTSAGTGHTVTHASTLTRSFRVQNTYPCVPVSAVFQFHFLNDERFFPRNYFSTRIVFSRGL